MANGTKKTKKVAVGVLTGVLVVGGIAGGMAGYRKFSKKPVNVYNLADFSYPASMIDSNNSSMGTVTTKGVQKIDVSSTQTITEVFVKEGQEVHVGDKLMAYDTTLTQLDLRKAEITVQKAQLELEIAEKELKKIGSNDSGNDPIILAYSGDLNGTMLASNEDDYTEPQAEPQESGETSAAEENTGDTTASETQTGEGQTQDPTGNTPETGTDGNETSAEEGTKEDSEETEPTEKKNSDTEEEGKLPGPRISGSTFLFCRSQEYALTDANLKAMYEAAGGSGTVRVVLEVHKDDNPEEEVLQSWGLLLSKDTSGNISMILYVPGGEEETTSEPVTKSTTESESTTTTEFEPATTTTTEFAPTTTTEPETETEEPEAYESGDDSGESWAEIQQKREAQKDKIRDLTVTLKLAQLDLEQKQKEFSDGIIYSKVDGIVKVVRDADEAYVNSEPIIEVSGGGGYYIEGNVSEWNLSDISIGMTVEVSDWGNYASCTGTIIDISTTPAESADTMDGSTGYLYTVYVDESEDIREGDWCSLEYVPETTGDDSWFLYSSFVRTEAGQSYVYAMGENGTLEKRIVVTGSMYDSMIKIKSGISQSDYLAFPYGDAVEGAKAKIADSSEYSNN